LSSKIFRQWCLICSDSNMNDFNTFIMTLINVLEAKHLCWKQTGVIQNNKTSAKCYDSLSLVPTVPVMWICKSWHDINLNLSGSSERFSKNGWTQSRQVTAHQSSILYKGHKVRQTSSQMGINWISSWQ